MPELKIFYNTHRFPAYRTAFNLFKLTTRRSSRSSKDDVRQKQKSEEGRDHTRWQSWRCAASSICREGSKSSQELNPAGHHRRAKWTHPLCELTTSGWGCGGTGGGEGSEVSISTDSCVSGSSGSSSSNTTTGATWLPSSASIRKFGETWDEWKGIGECSRLWWSRGSRQIIKVEICRFRSNGFDLNFSLFVFSNTRVSDFGVIW